MRIIAAVLLGLSSQFVQAKAAEVVFSADFEANNNVINFLSGCAQSTIEDASLVRSGAGAAICGPGSSTMVSKQAIAEQGLIEFWVKPENAQTSYRINIMTSASLKLDSPWQQIGMIETQAGNPAYLAYRISIDDPSRKVLRLDMEATNGRIAMDELSVERILLDTALSKNEQKIITGILDQLKLNKNYQVQSESFRTLGKNYAQQLETQRQYLEYANGIYSSITFVLASSERNKMSNPMAYSSFRNIIADTKRVASPLQQARLNSMVKPFGDLATATLTVVSGGVYAAFAEPFKSFLAATFDKSNYENADLSRKDKNFAEENGLKVYEKAERFLTELEKELVQVNALETDLQVMLKNVDSFRKDLDKHVRSYIQHGGLARTQENFGRVMSKDEATRQQVMEEVGNNVTLRAQGLLNLENNTELVQYVLKTSEQLEAMQEYKERFNQITASVITYYDRFERSIAPDQNPFTDPADKASWEQHAQKARSYIKQSKEAFTKAYM